MPEQKILTILEGGLPTSPNIAHYLSFSLPIPPSIQYIKVAQSRLVFYSQTDEIPSIARPPKRSFSRQPDWLFTERESLNNPSELESSIHVPRCIITEDNRAFLNEGYFEGGYKFYRRQMLELIGDCNLVFLGKKSIDDLNRQRRILSLNPRKCRD